jgi:hypothetical protein
MVDTKKKPKKRRQNFAREVASLEQARVQRSMLHAIKSMYRDIARVEPVDGALGYFVTDDGRVISCRAWPRHEPRVLRQEKAPDVPRTVGLMMRGEKKTHRVSRLVASAFVDRPPGTSVVIHRDGDVTNNRADNLVWVRRADAASGRKLSDAEIEQIRYLLASGERVSDVARAYDVSGTTIDDIRGGRVWREPPPQPAHGAWARSRKAPRSEARSRRHVLASIRGAFPDVRRVEPIESESDYFVTDDGRVISLRGRRPRVLNPVMTSGGKYCIQMVRGVPSQHTVARLVADAFLGPPPGAWWSVVHKDGDPTNCRAENLEWAAPSARTRAGHETRRAKIDQLSPEEICARIRAAYPDAKGLKILDGFSGYAVDSSGRLFSVQRSSVRVLRGDQSNGTIRLSDAAGNIHFRPLDAVVATALIGPAPTGCTTVVHRDGNAKNNDPTNLFWGTKRERFQAIVRERRRRSDDERE